MAGHPGWSPPTFSSDGPDHSDQGYIHGNQGQTNYYQGGYGPSSQHPQHGPPSQYPQHGPPVDYQSPPFNQYGPPQEQAPLQYPHSQYGASQGQGSPFKYPPHGQSQATNFYQGGPSQQQGLPPYYPSNGQASASINYQGGPAPVQGYQLAPQNGPPQGQGAFLTSNVQQIQNPNPNQYPTQRNQTISQAPQSAMPSHGNDKMSSGSRRPGETDMEVDEDLYDQGNRTRKRPKGQGYQHDVTKAGTTSTEDQMAEDIHFYKDRFLLSGLNKKIRDETLRDFVEVCSGEEVKKIEYSCDMSKAVVTLVSGTEPIQDWRRIKSGIAKRPLEGSSLGFQRLPISYKICVWHSHRDHCNLPLVDYFENKKSGNMAKSAVDVKILDEISVVTFDNCSVVDQVLSHKDHTVSGHSLVLTPFYDELGPVKQPAPKMKEETFRSLSKGELLLMNRLIESLKTEYTLEEVTVKDLEVKLKGDHSAVDSAIEKLNSKKGQIQNEDMKCSNLKAEYLNSTSGREEMIALLDKKDILASWICHSNRITIYAFGERDVTKTASSFEKDLIEENLDALYFDELNDHLKKKFDQGKFFLCRKTKQCFLAHKSIFSGMQREIDRFLSQRRPKAAQDVSLSPEEYRVLHIVMKEPMSRLRDDLQNHYNVEIQDSGTGLSVFGHEKDIRYVCEYLKDKIKRDNFHLDSKESDRFQRVGDHGILLKHIEDTKKCVIKMEQKTIMVTTEVDDLGAVGGSYRSEEGRSNESKKGYYDSDKGSHRSDGYFYKKGGTEVGDKRWQKKKSRRAGRRFVQHGNAGERQLKITLVEGEIAKTDAKVGVNVTTKSFDMEFGEISKSFKKEGGFSFEKECESYRTKKDAIKEGCFLRTGGGYLKFKHVFHCCLPLRKDDEKKYKQLVHDMLKDADSNLKCESIALPALGTGAFHTFDASWVADTLYSTVKDFEKQEQPKHLKEVKFVVYPANKNVVKAFKAKDKEWKASNAEKGGSPSRSQGSSFPKVTVMSGGLAEQKTEVIVNTSNSLLELSRGAVSKSILDKAGHDIQKECNHWRTNKGSLHPGKFAITGAGRMKDTKKLYHCNLPSYTHDAITKWLEPMLLSILETAEKFNMKDIAFPALGTGGLKYPPSEVANAFFKTVHTFGLNHSSCSLKEIRLVVYKADSHVLDAFRKEEKIFQKTCAESASSTPAEPPHDYDDKGNFDSMSEGSEPLKQFTVGPFTVCVKQGDISRERNTCIVNPINSNMSLKTGSVSKALAKVGGEKFQKETAQVEYILRGSHVALVHLNHDTDVLHLDRQYLEKCTVDAIVCCLKVSKSNGWKSISFPILLPGDAAWKMATDLYQALLMRESMAIVTVTDVTVVIYDKSQAETFCKKFDALRGGCAKEERKERKEEIQFMFHLYSDTYRRLKDTKDSLRGYAGDKKIVEIVQLPSTITEREISRTLRDYQDVNFQILDQRKLEIKGKPADVLEVLAVLKNLIPNETDKEVDENDLFGDGKGAKKVAKGMAQKHSLTGSTDNSDWSLGNYEFGEGNKLGKDVKGSKDLGHGHGHGHVHGHGHHSLEKSSLGGSTKTNYGNNGKFTEEDASSVSYKVNKGYKDPLHDFNNPNGPKSPLSSNQEKKGYKFPSDDESEDDSDPRSQTRGAEASDEPSNSLSMEDVPAAPYEMSWSFLDPDSEDLNQYGDDISRKIEKAYQRGDTLFDLPPVEDESQYIIDFKTMVEYPKTDPDDVVPVLRREKAPEVIFSTLNPPSSWSPMKGRDQMTTLKTSDGPFKLVKEHLENTRLNLPVFIVKIEKIQNKEVYGRYQWKKKIMKDSSTGAVERLLWHPCVSTDSIVPINKHGMNLHFCRPSGDVGEGIEFFESFMDIVQTTPDKNQYAYLCNVLVGDYTKGQRGIRDPPTGAADESHFYHSVVDNVVKPSKYLVFSDTQAEPQYLVTYKLEQASGLVED